MGYTTDFSGSFELNKELEPNMKMFLTKLNETRRMKRNVSDKFGVDGELFKKRQDLVKPIQDKVYNAIKDMAVKSTYAVVFDKASGTTMLYTNPKYDKSDLVLTNMGYKKGTTK